MVRHVRVRALIIRGKSVFCVRLTNYNNPTCSTPVDFWCMPGGKVEPGEALLPALERELIEELGVKPVIGNLLFIQQFEDNGQENLEFMFAVENAADFETIDITQTTHGAIEIAEAGFVDPKIVKVLPAFLATEDLAAHATDSGPTKIFNYLG